MQQIGDGDQHREQLDHWEEGHDRGEDRQLEELEGIGDGQNPMGQDPSQQAESHEVPTQYEESQVNLSSCRILKRQDHGGRSRHDVEVLL
jgi:hypothetical protein